MMCAKITKVYKEAKKKKFILCFSFMYNNSFTVCSSGGAREPWESRFEWVRESKQQCEQHSQCTWNFRQFFSWLCLYSHFRLSKCHAHSGRKAVVTYFHLSFIPFLFVQKLTKNALGRHNTTLMHTRITNTALKSALSLAVYLLPKNIEIIKKVFGCSLNLIHFWLFGFWTFGSEQCTKNFLF